MKSTATQADALLVRARRLLSDHRTRARKDGAALDYTLADVKQLLGSATTCTYCRTPLGWDVSLDHAVPVARGGQHSLDNLVACYTRCNQIKGQLSRQEMEAVVALLEQLHPAARQDIERRLIAGGRRYAHRR